MSEKYEVIATNNVSGFKVLLQVLPTRERAEKFAERSRASDLGRYFGIEVVGVL